MIYAVLIERAKDDNSWLLGPYNTKAEAEAASSNLELIGLSRNQVRSVKIVPISNVIPLSEAKK